VSRTNDITWLLSSGFTAMECSHKLLACQGETRLAQERLSDAQSSVAAVEARWARKDESSGAPSDTMRSMPAREGRAVASALASLKSAHVRELLAMAALIRAVCELVQATPGAFGADPPSELVNILCGLVNGVLGVWAVWAKDHL
jgi:hypothetical protein